MDLLEQNVSRRLTAVVEDRLAHEAVVALQGPRSVGKSTLLGDLATTHGVRVVDLDDLGVRDAVASDPALYVAGQAPVCIDEYQHVPAILDAIKAELNRDQRPGRFVITGSTRYDALPRAAQALTGRLHFVSVLPLSQGEIQGTTEGFVDQCMIDPSILVSAEPSTTTRTDYIDRVVAGGFPLALRRPPGAARNRWFDDYVSQSLARDAPQVANVRQRRELPRLLERLAGQTGQVLNMAAAASAVGLSSRTGENYTKVLEAVFLLHRVPSWRKTLIGRSTATPKIHMFDSGLGARLLRLSPSKLATLDPTSLTEFGHLLETFVVNELLKQASWSDAVAGYGHWRTHDGDEVDLVLERDDGAIVGFEVKTGSRVTAADLSGLRKLRDAAGRTFVGGVALSTGENSYTADDRLHVMPIDRLWAED